MVGACPAAHLVTRADGGTPGVAVLGAGPAGISAAAWLADLEIPFRWFERTDSVGGTLLRVGNPIRNLPAVGPVSGIDLAAQLRVWAAGLGLAPSVGVDARLAPSPDGRWAVLDGERELGVFRHVILSTGTRPRLLGVPGEAAGAGRGVEVSVTRNLDRYRGRRAVVVGGGDAAFEGALLLAPVCPQVDLVCRGSTPRAQRRFVERVAAATNVNLYLDTEVREILLDSNGVAGVALTSGERIDADGVFVRVGVEAQLPDGVPPSVRDRHGYAHSDSDCRTPAPGLLAAGDCGSQWHQSVAAAFGAAARAVATVRAAEGA